MRLVSKSLLSILIIFVHFDVTGAHIWARPFIYALIILISASVLIELFNHKENLDFNRLDLSILIYALYLLSINLISNNFSSNDRLYNLLLILLFYPFLIILLKIDKRAINYIFIGILLGLTLEIGLGFSQIFGISSNADSKFILGGLFGNPGALAGYLAITAPVVLMAWLSSNRDTQENLYYVIILCFLSALCLILLSNSRGSWIAAATGIVFVLNCRYKLIDHIKQFLTSTPIKITATALSLVFLLSIIYLLYNLKKDSADGRFFIWKTCLPMLSVNPLLGDGFGYFEENYGKLQAAYFATNAGTENEKQIADYVTCAYNEYLEMSIESGFIGLFLFLLILALALKTKNPIDNGLPRSIVVSAKASIIALTLLIITSYSFRHLPNVLLLVLCLSGLSTHQTGGKILARRHVFTITVMIFILISVIAWNGAKYIYGIYHFKNGYTKILDNDITGGINDYQEAKKLIGDNPKFNFYYGSALYLKQDYSEGIKMLRMSIEKNSDPNAFILLGNCYDSINQFKNAESAYLIAANEIPSRIYPKYVLAKLYLRSGQNKKAIKMAEEIIRTKEKVSSSAANQMKADMRHLIQDLKVKKP